MQAKGLQSAYRACVECLFTPTLKQINASLICSPVCVFVCLCVRVSLSGLLSQSGFNAVSGGLSRRGHVGINHSTFCFLATNPAHWSDKPSFSLDVTWRQLLSLTEQNLSVCYIFYV